MLTDTMGKLARINVTGQLSTMRAMAHYECAFTDAQLTLRPARVQLQRIDASIQAIQGLIDALSRDQDRWIEMIDLVPSLELD